MCLPAEGRSWSGNTPESQFHQHLALTYYTALHDFRLLAYSTFNLSQGGGPQPYRRRGVPCGWARCQPSQVYTAAMTLFSQIVAGDAWGEMSLPLLETQPWTAVILFATGQQKQRVLWGKNHMYSDEYDDVWRCFVFIGVRMDIVKLRSGCQIFWVDGFERLFYDQISSGFLPCIMSYDTLQTHWNTLLSVLVARFVTWPTDYQIFTRGINKFPSVKCFDWFHKSIEHCGYCTQYWDIL